MCASADGCGSLTLLLLVMTTRDNVIKIKDHCVTQDAIIIKVINKLYCEQTIMF